MNKHMIELSSEEIATVIAALDLARKTLAKVENRQRCREAEAAIKRQTGLHAEA